MGGNLTHGTDFYGTLPRVQCSQDPRSQETHICGFNENIKIRKKQPTPFYQNAKVSVLKSVNPKC